ncbi:DUF421 domain-containing protein [Chengkuizengella axinellae]|uniref:DUF421 domain-containing protein n=1 Tax=Chengkuizengella axinellae TaxID=3064388 RepID=A0ABT9ITY9_9BACL|nr:DUF421 domain-containing protein [Chengkuizengella sp. 2205SS18-9]MDP5272767.1 DUF421 domain-containing protein [Chengkuizengella sp. 2205SS18-9]
MDVWGIIIRTILIYVVVIIVMRIMGKREIGKLSVIDLVVSIMIAEIAVIVIEDTSRPMLDGILPMVILLLIQIITAMISLKNEKLRKWLDGVPSIIIKNGKLNREEMKKQRYNLDDLLLQLRHNNISDLKDVEFAILETNGNLSVVEKNEKNNSMPNELTNFRYEGLPLPLILDGKVQDDHLEKINKTRFWFKNQLQEHGVYDFKDVFFCSINHRGELYIDLKDKKN